MTHQSTGYQTPSFDDPREHDVFVRGCKAGLGMAAAHLAQLVAEYDNVGMHDVARAMERTAFAFANPRVTIVCKDDD